MPKLSKLTNRLRLSKRDVAGMDNILGEAKTGILQNIAAFFSQKAKEFGLVKSFSMESAAPEITAPSPQLLENKDNTSGEMGGSKVEQLLTEQTKILNTIAEQLKTQVRHEKDSDEQKLKLSEDEQESKEEEGRKGKPTLTGGKKEGMLGSMLPDFLKPLEGFIRAAGLVPIAIMGIAGAIASAGKEISNTIPEIKDWIVNWQDFFHRLKMMVPGGKETTEHQVARGLDTAAGDRRKMLEEKIKKGGPDAEAAKEQLKAFDEARTAYEKERGPQAPVQTGMHVDLFGKRLNLNAKSGSKMANAFETVGNMDWGKARTWFSNSDIAAMDKKKEDYEKRGVLDHPELDKTINHPMPPVPILPSPGPEIPAATAVATQLKQNIEKSGTGINTAAQQSLPQTQMQDVKNLSIDAEGLQFIKNHESFQPEAYWDPQGQTKTFSIGYGTRIDPHSKHPELSAVYGTPTNRKKKITEPEAEKLMMQEVNKVEKVLHKTVKVPIDQKMYNSLVDFGYNVGTKYLHAGKGGSVLMTKLNARDYAGATAEFGKGEKFQTSDGQYLEGLHVRRLDEKQEFHEGVSELQAPAPPLIVNEGPGRGEKLAAIATETALAGVNTPKGTSSVVIAPKTSVQNNKTSLMTPVDVNNSEDTHQWATRENYKPV